MSKEVGITFKVYDQGSKELKTLGNNLSGFVKTGMGLAGFTYTVKTFGRIFRNMAGDMVKDSRAVQAQLAAWRSSWESTKTAIAKPFLPMIADDLSLLNSVLQTNARSWGEWAQAAADAMMKVQNQIVKDRADQWIRHTALERESQERSAFQRELGYTAKRPLGPVNQARVAEIEAQLRRENAGILGGSLNSDGAAAITKEQEAARKQIIEMNEAMNRQVYIEAELAAGRKHASETMQYSIVLEKAYGEDVEKQIKLFEEYEARFEAIDRIQQQAADRKAMLEARDDATKLNAELQREFEIIGRLDESHQRAAKAVQYEQAVRKGYANDLATQNRLIADYEQNLRRLEQHQKLVEMGEQFGDAWGTALERFAIDGERASEAAKQLALDIARMTFRQTVAQPIANFFASAFTQGIGRLFPSAPAASATTTTAASSTAVMHAEGAIIDRPISWWEGGQRHVAGERGTEGLLPLENGPHGLSVRATGGMNSTQANRMVTLLERIAAGSGGRTAVIDDETFEAWARSRSGQRSIMRVMRRNT
ncbi:MAG: hypothetical protein ABFE01_26105 [Phycisphaerales bacterium]